MRYVLLIICMLNAGFYAVGQRRENANYYFWPVNDYTQKISFSESVGLPGANADTLFYLAKQFAAGNFKGDKDTIVTQDSAAKMVFCKGAYVIPVVELGERGQGYISFTLRIECKPNYYRYFLTDLEHFATCPDCVVGGPLENDRAVSSAMLFPRFYWDKEKGRCYNSIQATIQQLKNALGKAIES